VSDQRRLPRLAITLGDANGIGPEVAVRAAVDERVTDCCLPILIGDDPIIDRAATLLSSSEQKRLANIERDGAASDRPDLVVTPGEVNPEAGEAAFEWLLRAIDLAQSGVVDGIVTAPLSKLALHRAGHDYPGHTEILAERCGVREFAMMLYVPAGDVVRGPHGLAVAHTTLHTSIASVPGLLSTDRVAKTIGLVDRFLRRIGCDRPRVGVCALNPHAGEEGLFGDEESRIIRPAVESAKDQQIDVSGPVPADALMRQAADGEYDGVVAMYHDQGHIALKLLAFGLAVNVTLGLPIVRTSPSHGTAFDIAWQGRADAAGMVNAIRTAALLVADR